MKADIDVDCPTTTSVAQRFILDEEVPASIPHQCGK